MMEKIITVLVGISHESVHLFMEMAPYLLFGFLFAGLLHVFVSLEWIAKHLGKRRLSSVIKAVLLGIPLPLCSCGVIPAAVTLRKKGASRGAVVSFLISTPITGIDSILATYSLMGPLFTIYRVVSSAITAFIAGVFTNFLIGEGESSQSAAQVEVHCRSCCHKETEVKEARTFKSSSMEFFRYAFFELIDDIWKWLVAGVIIGGVISYAVPPTFVEHYLGSGWLSMLIMLGVGIPMYICATGSIPIAAALMLKGMSPGAALVFLLAGPATNAITIAVISKEMGTKTTVIYVGTIAVMSILFGFTLDSGWNIMSDYIPSAMMEMSMLPPWLVLASSILLLGLIFFSALKTNLTKTHDKN